MGDVLKNLRLKSQKRKKLLAQTLGLSTVDDLKHVLGTAEDSPPRKARRDADRHHSAAATAAASTSPGGSLNQATCSSASSSSASAHSSSALLGSGPAGSGSLADPTGSGGHLPHHHQHNRNHQHHNPHHPHPHQQHQNRPADPQFYRDSSTFLKGTQSSNPHNDYCQHFVDTGQRPQNFIRDVGLADRFEEYPKLRELIRLKDDLIAETATPPMYLQADLHQLDLQQLGSKFDVMLIEPPLEEYSRGGAGVARTGGAAARQFWSWDDIEALDLGEVAAHRSFVFLWCGSSEGLDMGRNCLRKWGFRRCEDICWIRTNQERPGHSKILEPKAVFQRTKEHCLMGIKGTVRRSTDGDFIHANVDIDLIISEEGEFGSVDKPIELFHIIEHFCLGRRRLHVFGRDTSIRPGWLTIGPELTNSNFNADLYQAAFAAAATTGCTERIEALRPKSPPANGKAGMRGRGGRGGGGGYARGGGGGGRGGGGGGGGGGGAGGGGR